MKAFSELSALDSFIGQKPIFNFMETKPLEGVLQASESLLHPRPLQPLNIFMNLPPRDLAEMKDGAVFEKMVETRLNLGPGRSNRPLMELGTDVLMDLLPMSGYDAFLEGHEDFSIREMLLVRSLVTDTVASMTSLPIEKLIEFFRVSEAMFGVMPKMGQHPPKLEEFIVQKNILGFYMNMDVKKLARFRKMLGLLGLNVDGGAFMQNMHIGVFDDVQRVLIDTMDWSESPLHDLLKPTNHYFDHVFPALGRIGDLDWYLNFLSEELRDILGTTEMPIHVVARLLSYKMQLKSETSSGIMPDISKIGSDLISYSNHLADTVSKVALKLPGLREEVAFEILSTVDAVAEGLVDSKIAVIDFIMKLPLDLVDAILEISPSVFSELRYIEFGRHRRDSLTDFWGDVQAILGTYNDYSAVLGVDHEEFPLERYARMSQHILTNLSDASDECRGRRCFSD